MFPVLCIYVFIIIILLIYEEEKKRKKIKNQTAELTRTGKGAENLKQRKNTRTKASCLQEINLKEEKQNRRAK